MCAIGPVSGMGEWTCQDLEHATLTDSCSTWRKPAVHALLLTRRAHSVKLDDTLDCNDVQQEPIKDSI